jgi:cobalamin synthase
MVSPFQLVDMKGSAMARSQNNASSKTGGDVRKFAKGEWWEWIAILFSIVALWPKILMWQGIAWDLVLLGALVLMVIVFVRRARRTKRSWKS